MGSSEGSGREEPGLAGVRGQTPLPRLHTEGDHGFWDCLLVRECPRVSWLLVQVF